MSGGVAGKLILISVRIVDSPSKARAMRSSHNSTLATPADFSETVDLDLLIVNLPRLRALQHGNFGNSME
jgi:hypothetical protein